MKKDQQSQREDYKQRVLIDLDGVIRDFIKGLKIVYGREYPDHVVKEVLSRDLHEFFPIGKNIYDFLKQKFGVEILLESPPYPGAIEALRKWEEAFEVVIVTAQPPDWRYATYSWIGNYSLPINEIKVISEKHTVSGYALLDDFTENLELFADTGRMAVCMDQPWNQDWKGYRVKTVEEFFQLIEKEMDLD
jgi:5'(3')-deoxyribonucleotidase